MTGADIIGALLCENTGEASPVAPGNIKGGRLPDGVILPALLVKVVSTMERQPLKRGPLTRTVDRVSVTVRASNHAQRRDVLEWVRRRCAGKTGNLAGALRVSILTAGAGPEVDGPADTYERSQDFRVSFDA